MFGDIVGIQLHVDPDPRCYKQARENEFTERNGFNYT